MSLTFVYPKNKTAIKCRVRTEHNRKSWKNTDIIIYIRVPGRGIWPLHLDTHSLWVQSYVHEFIVREVTARSLRHNVDDVITKWTSTKLKLIVEMSPAPKNSVLRRCRPGPSLGLFWVEFFVAKYASWNEVLQSLNWIWVPHIVPWRSVTVATDQGIQVIIIVGTTEAIFYAQETSRRPI